MYSGHLKWRFRGERNPGLLPASLQRHRLGSREAQRHCCPFAACCSTVMAALISISLVLPETQFVISCEIFATCPLPLSPSCIQTPNRIWLVDSPYYLWWAGFSHQILDHPTDRQPSLRDPLSFGHAWGHFVSILQRDICTREALSMVTLPASTILILQRESWGSWTLRDTLRCSLW